MKISVILVSADAAWRRSLRHSRAADTLEFVDCEDRCLAARRAADWDRAAIVFASPLLSESWQDVRVAEELRRANRFRPLILVVAGGSEELAVAAMRSGMNDLLHRAEVPQQLVESVKRISGLDGSPPDPAAHPIVGISRSIQELRNYLAKVAATDSNVLITGETGTGKELAAEFLHQASARRNKRLVPINCSAIPDALVESELFGHERGAFTGAQSTRPGKFQLAEGGTVFLDEIGDMEIGAQAKLLRVLESREVYTLGSQTGFRVNVRVVAATNRDPEQLMRENRFRNDLYFRLNVARIHLAPLRERKEDIPALVQHCINELSPRFGFRVDGCSEDAYALLMRYDWPGNVRELKNLLEATLIGLESRTIRCSDFPPEFHRRFDALAAVTEAERDRLISALSATNWNVSKAAAALHWSRMTMYRKIAKYNIPRS